MAKGKYIHLAGGRVQTETLGGRKAPREPNNSPALRKKTKQTAEVTVELETQIERVKGETI
jgi:hypothetical protein